MEQVLKYNQLWISLAWGDVYTAKYLVCRKDLAINTMVRGSKEKAPAASLLT